MSKTLLKFKEQMSKIKHEITANDRKEIERLYGIDKSTISLYVNNVEGANNVDTYFNILSFMKGQIEKRNSILA